MTEKTIFQKIIDREIPAEILHENDHVIVIKDIAPIAPIHYLIISKKLVVDMADPAFDAELAAEMTKAVQHLAAELDDTRGFNIICNNGPEAGQAVYHVHWHFISGRNLYADGPSPVLHPEYL
jgi:histidine triad (HIT) family protein